jgi:hypothetical protein
LAEKERWDGWLGPKQWMPIVAILSVAIVALAVVLFLNMGDDDPEDAAATPGRVPTHEHADFALFVRGQRFDFDKPEFTTSEDETPVSDNVHIHEPRINVVHAHTTLTTWDEFWSSIGFALSDPSFPGVAGDNVCMTFPDGTKLCNTDTETWKFVANGVEVDGLANVTISDLSRVLFSYGPKDEDVFATQWPDVSDEACIPSGLCLERGAPEDEPCGGQGVCTD